jgi:hypothetical protein
MAVLAMREPPSSVTASNPWPVRASVTQALLPVRYAWNASDLDIPMDLWVTRTQGH